MTKVIQEPQVQLDFKARKEIPVRLVLTEPKETLVPKARKVTKEILEPKVYKV